MGARRVRRRCSTGSIALSDERLDVDDDEDLLPDIGYSATSRILFALLNVRMRLTTGELADWAEVSTETVRNRRDELGALGFIVVEETGPDKANWFRFSLPFRPEREDEDAPVPRYVEGSETIPGGWEVHDVLAEALRGFGIDLVIDHYELWMSIVDGEVRVDVLEERWPRLRGWSEVITRLLGERSARSPVGPRTLLTTLGESPPDSPPSPHNAAEVVLFGFVPFSFL